MNYIQQYLRILVSILTLCLMAEVEGAESVSFSAVASNRVSARPELIVTTLGFGSCAREDRPQPIWDTIHAARCDAFVLVGDNIYADTSDPAVFSRKCALLDGREGLLLVARATAKAEDSKRALDLAGDIRTTFDAPAAR